MAEIWVVEDEANIRGLIRRYLENDGYKVRTFSAAEPLQKALGGSAPDMFILDIMLPGLDGLALCRHIRDTLNVPIVFVSARGEEFDRVLGLELGADDYLAKPFSPRELVVRVGNIFRRLQQAQGEPECLTRQNLTIFPAQRKVKIGNSEVVFSSREFDLLFFLAASPNRPYSRSMLLDKLWGYDFEGSERAVDDTVKRIRRKMKQHRARPQLATVWGYGYKLDV